MELSNVYKMSSETLPNALHVTPLRDESWTFYNKDTEQIRRLVKGEVTLQLPLRFMASTGEIAMDQITTSLLRIHILSDRVLECLRQNSFTGWSTFPVIVTGKNGADVLGYRGLAVTGRCGPVDSTRSVRTTMPSRVSAGDADRMIGLFFDTKSWDGSHIFTPNGGHIFVVEDVKRQLEGIAATNIRFRPLSQIENYRATLGLRGKII